MENFTLTEKPSNSPENNNTAKRSAIKAAAVDFGERTTAHGVGRFTAATSLVVRLIWLVICFLMWGIFLWQGSLEVKKYFNYDVTYDIAVVFRELPFPAVTICNLNPLRQSKLGDLGTEYLNELGFLDFDTTDDNQTSEFDWNAEIPVDSDWDDDSNFFDGFDDEYAAEINLTRIMSILDPSLRKSVGHQSKDFIQECTFNGGKCSTANFTLVLNSKYGNCFSFNTGINDSEILSTVRPGPTRGLTLTLFIEQDEYLTDYTENAGAVVLVHPHSIVAFPEEQGIEVPPGFSTSIGVRLSEIIRKGGDYSDCTDGTDIDMLYDDDYSYSREACLSSCLQQALIDTCLCYEPTLPHSADVEMCSKVSGGTTCQAGVTNQHNKNQLGCTDTCPPSCNDRTYETVVSMSQWPSEAYDDTLFRRLSKRSSKIQDQLGSIEDSRRNLIQLKVYYQELNYQSITEKPALDETGLLSNLGGLMGLYIGASVVSLFELIEFLCVLIYIACRKVKTAGQMEPVNA